MPSLSLPPLSRVYLLCSVVSFVIGWALFMAAAIRADAYTVSHKMRGYEWLPGAVMSLALVGMAYFPRRRPSQNEDTFERRVMFRMVVVVGICSAGAIFGAVLTTFEWMAPPDHKIVEPPSGNGRLFNSPSPTPQPRYIKVPSKPDQAVGSILYVHYACLGATIVFAWLYTDPPFEEPPDSGPY